MPGARRPLVVGPLVVGPLAAGACALLLLCLGASSAGAEEALALTKAEVARAVAARASIARVRWRDGRFGDVSATRHAVVVRRDGLLLMAGLPPSRQGSFTALLPDGRELRAQIVGSDAQTALTLLRVQASGLVPLPGSATPPPPEGTQPSTPELSPPPLGQRLLMVTGDGAVAVGPVRAHDRYGRYVDPRRRAHRRTTGLVGVALAAVDADAGAPLLDARGRLAGLLVGRKDALTGEAAANAAGLRARPTAVEVLALPASVARLVWPLLERHGRLPRAGLGIETREADEALRQHLGLEGGGHVLLQVEPGGAGARQGLRKHDVLVSLDGRAVRPGTTLHDLLLPYRPGARVRLGLVRGGKALTLDVQLAELP